MPVKLSILPLAAAALFAAAPALAALPVGAKAPAFTTDAALGGKAMPFVLADALKKGPVVLYFFPKVFTQGCTVEAHAFSDASADFAKMGATVIGLSADEIDGDKGLKAFSTVECRDKFAVGVATPKIIGDYDVKLLLMPGRSDRVSYVIAPDGKIVESYTALTDPTGHVTKAMDAVKAWNARHKG
jgi:peroxiredoxin Q/BCP